MKMIATLLVLFSVASARAQTEEMTMPSAYPTNLKMREERKVGVGTQLGGTAGTLGFLVDLNVVDTDGAVVGFGFGDEYSTFSAAWKHNFEGRYFTPYTTVGWSRWYSAGTGRQSASHILDGMLTSDEKADGRFGLDLVAGGFGGQYQELSGDFAGLGFFAEVNLMVAPFRGKALPSAALGATYFF